LLNAVSQQRGLVVLVVGAGCSLEAPTNLKLARDYALEIHRKLIDDGVLDDGDCLDPEDLSLVTTAVFEKRARQAPVVERLPRSVFRTCRPNEGYVLAAALLREGSISCVLTINFDLAMSNALSEVSASDVTVIAGPTDLPQLGASTVIYLHRNVDETNLERWILRREALEEEWRDDWQQVVAQRVMAAPITVFAGLGSPAAVLTETISRIRQAVADVLRAYVVDPAAETAFAGALDLPETAHIRLGWGEFMRALARRVAAEHRADLESACRNLCDDHGWASEKEGVGAVCGRFADLGLLLVGKLRARWLFDDQMYAPDDARRDLVADLILGVALIERGLEATALYREDGAVEFRQNGTIVAIVLPASGAGTRRWTALEARIRTAATTMRAEMRPTHALVGGVQGERPNQVSPPEDVVTGETTDDIISGLVAVHLVSIDDLRNDPEVIRGLAA
jgi:hypothetical protein